MKPLEHCDCADCVKARQQARQQPRRFAERPDASRLAKPPRAVNDAAAHVKDQLRMAADDLRASAQLLSVQRGVDGKRLQAAANAIAKLSAWMRRVRSAAKKQRGEPS